MKTSLKTGFAQIFSCCPQKMGGCPPGPYAPLKETKKDKLFFNNYVVLTFLGEKKIYPFLELVEDKPEYLFPASEVCHVWRASNPPQAVLLWKISKIKQSLVEYRCRATSLTLLTGKIKDSHAATVKKSYIEYKYDWNLRQIMSQATA